MLKIDNIKPMSEYLKLLRSSDKIYIDKNRLEFFYRDCAFESEKYRELTRLNLRIESAGKYLTLSKESIIDYLYDTGVDMQKRFRNRKVKGDSLDMKKVIDPLLEAGIATSILSEYKMHRTYTSYTNFLRKMRERSSLALQLESGRLVVPYETHVNERQNLRAYYEDLSVVSIPKIASSMITTNSEDKYIAWVDYPQADFKFAYNLFLKTPENMIEMSKHKDSYEGIASLVEKDKFNLEAFKENRKEYKVNALSVLYNSSVNAAVPNALRDYYKTIPKYRQLLEDLDILQKFMVPIPCTSYFGYEQFLPENKIRDSFISKGLNTPVQTFTSEVIIATVFGVLERFWELGYTKDDINIYFVRHDEPLFIFSKKILRDAYIFKDCSEIFIEGFTPIHLDFFYGKYYKEEDEYITNEINKVCESNTHLLHHYEGGEIHEYNPLPSCAHLAVNILKRDEYILEIYNYKTQKIHAYEVDINESDFLNSLHDTIIDLLSNRTNSWLGKPRYILLECQGLDCVDGLWEESLLKIINTYNNNVFC